MSIISFAAGAAAALALTGCTCASTSTPDPESHPCGCIYPATMQLVSIERREYGDLLTFSTGSGMLFQLSDWAEDWDVGDLASMIMYDNGTPNDITDDAIVSVRYAGYPELFNPTVGPAT